jgi:hypothetical protein
MARQNSSQAYYNALRGGLITSGTVAMSPGTKEQQVIDIYHFFGKASNNNQVCAEFQKRGYGKIRDCAATVFDMRKRRILIDSHNGPCPLTGKRSVFLQLNNHWPTPLEQTEGMYLYAEDRKLEADISIIKRKIQYNKERIKAGLNPLP